MSEDFLDNPFTGETGGCGQGTVKVVAVDSFGGKRDLGCFYLPSSMDGMVTYIDKEPTVQGSADDLFRMIYGALPPGQYYQVGQDEDGKNYVYSAITVPGLGEVQIATYESTADGIIRTPNAASQDWEVIKQILRSQGYSDAEINSIEDSLHRSTTEDGTLGVFCHTLTTFAEGCEFRGSTTLANILGEIGFDGGWWDVRPGAGTDCTTDDGKEGTVTIEDGNEFCKANPDKIDGQSCPGPHSSQGVYEDGECVAVLGADCMQGSVPGKIDANGDCDTSGDGTDDEGTFEDYVNEVGEDIANTAKDIYDEMKDVLTECVGSPLDCIKKIGDVLAEAGMPDHCKDLESCATADGTPEGGYCWKDCVTFNVLMGLPIPIPNLPGMQEIGTWRDFEDFLKGMGKSIEDFFEDPAGTVEGWIDAIIDKIKGIFTDVAGTDPTAIMDWLKGIFGAAVAGWVWGQIEDELNLIFPFTEDPECPEDASEINETNFEKCGYKPCNDGTYVKTDQSCPEEPTEDFDCSTVGRPQTEGAQEADDCGESCLEEGFVINPNSGHCYDPNEVEPDEDKQDCDEKGRVWDEAKDECSDNCQNPKYEVDDVSGECGPVNEENTCEDEFREKNPDGSCGDKCLNGDPAVDGEPCPDPNVTEVDCDDPQNADHPDCTTTTGGTPCEEGVSIFPYISAITRRNQWYRDCSQTHCWQGYDQPCPPKDANGNCPGDINCDDPQSDAEYEQCDNWFKCPDDTPNKGQWVTDITACGNTGGFTCTDTNATNTGETGPCVCPDPYIVSEDGKSCIDPRCGNGAENYPECDQCPRGLRYNDQTDECEELDCTDPKNALACGWVECDDGNMAPTLGDCNQETPCKDPAYAEANPLECGWVECTDGSFAPTPDECQSGTCDNGATDYPACITCPPGQTICESTGKCSLPEDCTGGGDDSGGDDGGEDGGDDGGGSSGGGGGGGRGVPSGLFTDITANPELLGRKRIPQTDPFAGIFDTGEDFPIASFLSNGLLT